MPQFAKSIEVFNPSSGSKPVSQEVADNIKIKNTVHLGSGGQADVYKCILTTSQGNMMCVAKTVKVYNN